MTQQFYDINNLHEISWVIIEYPTKETVKYIIRNALSINVEEDKVCINFLKQSKFGKKLYGL